MMCLTSKLRILSFLAVLLVLSSTSIIIPSSSAFTTPPTMDLTTSSEIVGATNAIYSFHAENPDSITIVSFSVPIPAGYSIDPTYMTTTTGIVVMTGVYGFIGQPINGYLKLETTVNSGVFAVYAERIIPPFPYVLIGSATIIPPTSTIPGTWTVTLGAPNNGEYIDLSFVAGFFINPSTPGVYTWGPSTATGSDQSSATMNPRLGFTNEVTIITARSRATPYNYVGGELFAANKLAVLSPYLALIGVIAVASIVAKRKST